MNIERYFERIKRIDDLIRRKSTGNPKELAYKLGVGERTIYEYINLMKVYDAPIYFCKTRNSYCYEYAVKFNLKFEEYGEQ